MYSTQFEGEQNMAFVNDQHLLHRNIYTNNNEMDNNQVSWINLYYRIKQRDSITCSVQFVTKKSFKRKYKSSEKNWRRISRDHH